MPTTKPFRQSYKYAYPDNRSYSQIDYSTMQAGPGYEGQALRHGFIFGYKSTGLPVGVDHAGPDAVIAPNGDNFLRTIDFENSKMFQFNPPHMPVALGLMEVDNADAQDPRGLLFQKTGVGVASTTLEMYFNRTREVNSSMAGFEDPLWRELGVQIDLFDVLRVISGGDESLYSGDTQLTDSPYGGTVRQDSLNKLTGSFYDAVISGTNIQFQHFAIVFNPNLAMHVQRITSFSFDFLQFTKDLVPTTMQIMFELQIANMGTSTYVNSGGAIGAQTQAANAPPGQIPPPGTTAAPTGPGPTPLRFVS